MIEQERNQERDLLARRRNRGESMTESRVFIRIVGGVLGGVLLALVLLPLFGCSPGKNDQSRATDKAGAVAINVVPVEVAVAERKALSVTKTYSGTLEGEEQANIVAKIPERITGIKVSVGESVRSGQIIVTLDKSGASSQYYQAEAGFKNAEKTLARMKSLYDEGAISLQSLDGTQTAYDVAKANFEAARSEVELTTPISGAVTAINVSKGDLAGTGAVLATIASIGKMKVTFDVNEGDVPGLAIGQKIQVRSEMRPDIEAVGRIVQLSKSADVRSRSFEIKGLFPNSSDKWFKPGMFCNVDVHMSPRANALVAPSGAIQSDGVTNRVFVVRNGRSFQRTVQVGIADVDNTEILGGLAEGDTVVTVGASSLRDSSFVNVISPSGGRRNTTR